MRTPGVRGACRSYGARACASILARLRKPCFLSEICGHVARVPTEPGRRAAAAAASCGAAASRPPRTPRVERFTASIHFDQALARYDIRLSLAHARMLHHRGLLSADDERAIRAGAGGDRARDRGGKLPDRSRPRGHPHERGGAAARADRARGGPPAHGAQPQRPGRHRPGALSARCGRGGAARAARAAPRAGGAGPRARGHGAARLHPPPARAAGAPRAPLARLRRDARARRRALPRPRAAGCGCRPLGAGALAGTTLPLDREETARALGFDAPAAQQHGRRRVARRGPRVPGGDGDRDGAPLAPGRGAGAVVDRRVRLRRARRRLRHGLEPDAPEEEPRRARAGPRQDPAARSGTWWRCSRC